MTRTDSPTNMDPADYEYVFAFDSEKPGPYAVALMQNLAADRPHSDTGHSQCDHCGAWIRYKAILRHLPTQALIVVGETCLDNRFSLESKAQFDTLRKAAELDRKAQRIKTTANAQLDEMSDIAQLLLMKNLNSDDIDYNLDAALIMSTREHHIVSDIRNKLWLYGSVSERQVAVCERAYNEGWAKPREVAEVATVEAPTGKVSVQGTVVSTKVQYSDYGSKLKMLVVCDTPEGQYKVWSSVPAGLHGLQLKGLVVSFTATLSPSDDDESFAFASRPSKAKIVS